MWGNNDKKYGKQIFVAPVYFTTAFMCPFLGTIVSTTLNRFCTVLAVQKRLNYIKKNVGYRSRGRRTFMMFPVEYEIL